jgi:hypothetical protein
MKKKSLYTPVKEKLEFLIEYINILESKKNFEAKDEIKVFLKIIEMSITQCEEYLNFKLG